jgi:2-phosphosulfolactate phosphatase
MNPEISRTVVIDCFPENVQRYRDEGYTIVAVDVIRATTTAVTASAMGRRCFPVASLENALTLAAELEDPLMVGELAGEMPAGFHISNSPALVAQQNDIHRPMVLLSTSGTKIIIGAKGATACYLACLRNYSAQIQHLISNHSKVAVIGAGTRGEFREEDQMCCGWIADGLLQDGFTAVDEQTAEIAARWRNAPVEAFLVSKSVAYLRRSGQLPDLDFVLAHIDDLPAVFLLVGDEVVMLPFDSDISKGSPRYMAAKAPEPELNANI